MRPRRKVVPSKRKNVSKRSIQVVLGISIALVLFTIIGGLSVSASSDDGAYRQLSVYSEVLSRINSEYVEQPNMGAVTDGALHGLLESLDANSSYLTPAEYKQYREHKTAGKASIDAVVSKRFGYAAVISVIPGGAAEKAGVESGDIIESIDGKSSRDMSLAEILTTLSGEPGSRLNFSIVRARHADPVKVTVIREVENVPPATNKVMESNIGYIKTDTLDKGKAPEVAAKIKEAEKNGAKKIILDLRGCAEGDIDEGVALANLFLDHGVITYLQGQKYPRETFSADASKKVTSLPLVVLVNRSTAGPAEVAAAAILDNARGDVLGDKTFGVGSVQKVIEMQDGSALILSVAKYYSPSGKAIQDTAVTPNIQVADNNDDLLVDEDSNTGGPAEPRKKGPQDDEQLRRAIDVLNHHDQKAQLTPTK
jgi:carboxyl-terminal processing protease